MSTLVIVLRAVSLLALASLLLLAAGRRGRPGPRARHRDAARAPALANFAAFGLFFPSLLAFPGGADGLTALLLASLGALLAVAGAALVLGSRAELGPAWSFVPAASRETGLVTTGPYRHVRHPIYLGLALLAVGQALAFGNWHAVSIVVCGIVPTFAWRARAEETLLGRTFGDRYAVYQRRTGRIIPRRRSTSERGERPGGRSPPRPDRNHSCGT